MKTASLLLCGLLLSAAVVDNASAATVRVRLTARVTQVQDPSGALGGLIVPGRRLTGLYTYNTNTPSTFPGSGQYIPYAGEARVRFVSGTLVFESRPLTQGIEITVQSQQFGNGRFSIWSNDNLPLANGTAVGPISIDFQGQGNVTTSNSLPNAVPNLTDYWTRQIIIGGTSSTGAFYNIQAQIEVAEAIAATIEVTPADGTFLSQQQFDAAVLLPAGKTAASMHASTGVVPIYQFDYPGQCQIASPNSSNRQALYCPYAHNALGDVPAGTTIDFSVTLTDGTVLTQSVEWTLLQ